MSLYYDAASLLEEPSGGSLKCRVYNNRALRSPPAQVYALLSETIKWNPELNEVIEKSGVLAEKKLTPCLALLLVHDQLLSKCGIAAPIRHPLRVAISNHKARLKAEFTRLRLKKGFATVEAFRDFVNCREDAPSIEDGSGSASVARERPQPRVRWARVNTLRTTLVEQLETTFAEFKIVGSVGDLSRTGSRSDGIEKFLYIDKNIPNLVGVSRKVDLSQTDAYQKGDLVLQDKASCFPAQLLDISSIDGEIIDACAAPGNKTTHLASLLDRAKSSRSGKQRIWAVERDKTRASTLKEMIQKSGAGDIVTILAGQDFTRLNPSDKKWARVEALLLDPSCSGSGILDRDVGVNLILPYKDTSDWSRPRKRQKILQTAQNAPVKQPASSSDRWKESVTMVDEVSTRLTSLATFQLKLLRHAFCFSSARRIVYSTCSIHDIENEHVVVQALCSQEATTRGWTILLREDQYEGLKDWDTRGHIEPFQALFQDDPARAATLADACIRCDGGGPLGTIGFFIAGFVRPQPDGSSKASPDEDCKKTHVEEEEKGEEGGEEDEWQGFSSDSDGFTTGRGR